jgi:4-amino-4-deoxy-L-arabinose transferase-like glycosyltransferase
MLKLTHLLEKPRSGLLVWALYHVTVWTGIPLACNTCLPLDSIEAIMWGSQWQWGYDKHPPLSAWAAELFTSRLGDAGLYLLSQLCIIAAGLGIYRLGRLLKLSGQQALMAVLLLDTIYFYQYISVEFNVNYLQMPFWAWGWFFGINAVQNKRLSSWLGLGVCVALGALTKYIAVFMLVPLFAAWWQRKELLTALRSPGLWIAGLTAGLLFTPHLLWMKDNDWITIAYGLSRGASEEKHWWYHLWQPLKFVLAQGGILLPALVTAWICKVKKSGKPEEYKGTVGFALGAYVFLAALSLATGMKLVNMWAAPMPLAVGLWLVPRFRIDQNPRILLRAMALLSLVFVVGYCVVYGFGPLLRKKPHRVNYPGKAIAVQVENRWKQAFNRPLPYLIADEWLGGIVNYYGQDRAAVMIRARLKHSTYLTEEQVHTKGAVILWLKSLNQLDGEQRALKDIYPDIPGRFPQLEIGPDLVIPWPRKNGNLAGRYGIAFIPPAHPNLGQP